MSGRKGVDRRQGDWRKRARIEPVSIQTVEMKGSGSASRTRTYDRAINSRLLYQLSYRGTASRLITKTD